MLNELLKRYSSLESAKEEITKAENTLINGLKNSNKLLICGNGGSCADCEHIVGELMKGFLSKRPIIEEQKKEMKANCPEIDDKYLSLLQRAAPAISLPSFTALNTAFCNDVDPDAVYAQLVMALGKPEDVFVGLSTSGNAKNICEAAITAKARGLKVIGLTGMGGGKLADLCDCCIQVPETETFKVQELHLPVYHCICAVLEAEFFK